MSDVNVKNNLEVNGLVGTVDISELLTTDTNQIFSGEFKLTYIMYITVLPLIKNKKYIQQCIVNVAFLCDHACFILSEWLSFFLSD